MWNKKFYRPDFDDNADYNTNSESYYKYLSKFTAVINKIIGNVNNAEINDTKTIKINKNGNIEDENLTLSADVKLSQDTSKNSISIKDDGLYSKDLSNDVDDLNRKINEIVIPGSGIFDDVGYHENNFLYGANHQDATYINGLVAIFEESPTDHSTFSNIHIVHPYKFYKELKTIKHNLGHSNGVDFKQNTLMSYSYNPTAELNLISNPDIDSESWATSDPNYTNITFYKEEIGHGLLGGSACFGENKNIIFMAEPLRETEIKIYKILLGNGVNDLSDKTENLSDETRWGKFIPGKNNNEYNGTAKILNIFTGNLYEKNMQPQGMCYENGNIYMACGFSSRHAYKLKLNKIINTVTIEKDYRDSYNTFDYSDGITEPESVFVRDNMLIIGDLSYTFSSFPIYGKEYLNDWVSCEILPTNYTGYVRVKNYDGMVYASISINNNDETGTDEIIIGKMPDKFFTNTFTPYVISDTNHNNFGTIKIHPDTQLIGLIPNGLKLSWYKGFFPISTMEM